MSFVYFLLGLTLLGLFFWYFATEIEKKKRLIGSILVSAVAVLAFFAVTPPKEKLKGGIDIVGGTSVTVRILDEPFILVRGKNLKDNEAQIDSSKRDAVLSQVREIAAKHLPDADNNDIATNGPNGILIVSPEISKANFELLKKELTTSLREVTRNNLQNQSETNPALLWKITSDLDPDAAKDTILTAEAMENVKTIIGNRVNPGGTKDISLYSLGLNRVVVEAPGLEKEERDTIRKQIEQQATLELRAVHRDTARFADEVANSGKKVLGHSVYKMLIKNDETGETEKDENGDDLTRNILLKKGRAAIEGGHITNAFVDYGRNGVVALRLNEDGGDRMLNLTSKMTPGVDQLAIVINGVCTSAPVVNGTLGRQFEISGLNAPGEAAALAAALNNPLRNPLLIEEANDVSAKLGEATVKQGIYAGIAGLALTFIFILIYYRVAGIVALIGLAINILILFGCMAAFGFTFTLPGIAGIVLTIGVAVDANVLIYERLREELKAGKSLGNAIRNAYDKAFSSIFDANITTLITALILFWRASETVKGFAITLTIGILASMFTALLATRVLFRWGVDLGILKKLGFLNLIPEKSFQFMNKGKVSLLVSIGLIVASLGLLGFKGNNAFGVDFVGGTRISYQLGDQDLDTAKIDGALKAVGITTAAQKESNQASGNLISIRCNSDQADAAKKIIAEQVPELASVEVSEKKVGATLGDEFKKNSIFALGLGLIAILIYITVRFEFSFAVGAFVALFHDIIICIGIVIALGTELSLIHVGAFLTVAGYSINDTIIIFDRIRESLQTKRGDTESLMNQAINATLSRTVLTSLTTFVSVVVLWFFGGPALKDFSIVIMIGVLIGTYSSIFVAAPLVLFWSKKRGTNLRKELLDANLEAEVSPSKTRA